MKKLLTTVLAVWMAVITVMAPVQANSAETHWRGADAAGAIVVDGQCPIEVEKEVLTFDVSEFPSNLYYEKEEYLSYKGKVTAEYTFRNPTDLTVTATLAFPFGVIPDYIYLYDKTSASYVMNADAERYDITVNGEPIGKNIRYTLKADRTFDLTSDLPKLRDTYQTDPFYSPDMTVTQYTYTVSLNEEKATANVAFDWNGGDGKTKLWFPKQGGFHAKKNGDAIFGTWASNGDTVIVYAIGQPLSVPMMWKCYANGRTEDADEIDGTVTLTSTETTTLEALVLTHWDETTGISKIDWYNAAIDSFRESADGYAPYHFVEDAFGFLSGSNRYMKNLMRWYEYNITVAPHESIVNTVTAPIYPSINADYEPAVFSYTYFLSPASTWASFDALDVVIRTPFFITENSLDGFEKTDVGYALSCDGLPEGELEFTLCSVEKPSKGDWMVVEDIFTVLLYGVPIILGAVLFTAVIFFSVRKLKKK